MAVETDTQKHNSEDMTSARAPKAPERDKSLERNYPAEQRHGGENRTDSAAPSGPVQIPVKK